MKGDRLVVGIHESNFRHYARNLSTGEIINTGFEEKQVPRSDYFCQFNGYRALRPRVNRSDELKAECLFYCQDASDESSLLRRTPLFRIRLPHYVWNAYHNLAPVDVLGHFLLVPATDETLHHYRQTLNHAIFEDFLLLRSLDANFLFFYNSLGAGASVDHLHFQAVYRRQRLAIEKQAAPGTARQIHATAEQITKLHDADVPFNLVASAEFVYLIERHVEPETKLSALDLAGRIVTTDRSTYESITREKIEAALNRACRSITP